MALLLRTFPRCWGSVVLGTVESLVAQRGREWGPEGALVLTKGSRES